MDLPEKIAEYEKLIWDYLPKISDPFLQQLLTDHNSMKRALEIVTGITSTTHPDNDHFYHVDHFLPATLGCDVKPVGAFTRGDACVKILQDAGRPLHVNEISEQIKKHGFDSPPRNLVGIMKRDSLNRFIPLKGNIYKLNEAAIKATPSAQYYSNGKNPMRRHRTNKIKDLGITLKQAILMAIETQDGEFGQPDIYRILVARYPKAAVNIQKTTVAVTLNNLAKNGIIKETYGGYGRIPKRYRKKFPNDNLMFVDAATNAAIGSYKSAVDENVIAANNDELAEAV